MRPTILFRKRADRKVSAIRARLPSIRIRTRLPNYRFFTMPQSNVGHSPAPPRTGRAEIPLSAEARLYYCPASVSLLSASRPAIRVRTCMRMRVHYIINNGNVPNDTFPLIQIHRLRITSARLFSHGLCYFSWQQSYRNCSKVQFYDNP